MSDVKVWYKVSRKGGGWCKYNSLQGLLADLKKAPYFPVLKITKITEEVQPQSVVDEINSQVFGNNYGK